MFVKDILSRADILFNLRRLIDTNKYPHALLIKGKAGSGKLALARALAQYLICKNKLDTDSCGTCSNCHKSLKSIHPDIHFSFPISGAKVTCNDFMNEFREFIQESPFASGKDWIMQMGDGKKAGNITAAECNRISKNLYLKPYEAAEKVFIIWLPEFLGKEGNRLLKLIEEPPPNTFFIFVSDQAELILGTILSRCQIINIPPIQNIQIEKILIERYSFDQELAQSLANLSDGNISYALKLAAQPENKHFQLMQILFRSAYQGHTASITKAVDALDQLTKEECKTFLQYCIHFLRQCLLIRYLSQNNIQLQKNEINFANKFVETLNDDIIQVLTNDLSNNLYYLERNANIKLAMLNFTIRMHYQLTKRIAEVA